MRKSFSLVTLIRRNMRQASDHVRAIIAPLGPYAPYEDVALALRKCNCGRCQSAYESLITIPQRLGLTSAHVGVLSPSQAAAKARSN